jgi:hypothetical protein
VFSEFFTYPIVWIFFILVAIIAVIPDLVVKIIENLFFERQLRKKEEKLALLKNKCSDVPKSFKEQQRKRKGINNINYEDLEFKLEYY